LKKTLEWMPETTQIDSVSVLVLGIETLIERIGALDARTAANAGAMRALNDGVRLPLRDVVEDSLEWVGDVRLAVEPTDKRPTDEESALLEDCFIARSELRRASGGLDRPRDNVYSTLTQLKDIASCVRSALTTVVDGALSLEPTTAVAGAFAPSGLDLDDDLDDIDDDVEEIEDNDIEEIKEIGEVAEAPPPENSVSHEYRLNRKARIERVINRPPTADPHEEASPDEVVLFTEVSNASNKTSSRWIDRRFDGLRKMVRRHPRPGRAVPRAPISKRR